MPHTAQPGLVQIRVSMVTADSQSSSMRVPGWATFADIDLKLASGTAWGSAVMDLQFALAIGVDDTDRDIEQWNAFSPVRQMSTTTTNLRSVPVLGLGYVRIVCSTADAGADPDASALIRFA